MAKNEQANFMEKLKSNVGLWFLVGMVALLLLRFMLMALRSAGGGDAGATPTIEKLTSTLDEGGTNYVNSLIVNKMVVPLPPFKESELYPLAQYNMFDPKLVQNAPALERAANDRFALAQSTYARGDLQGARDTLREVLGMLPNHAGAQALLKEIDAKLKAPAGGATGAATSGTLTRAANGGTSVGARAGVPGGPGR